MPGFSGPINDVARLRQDLARQAPRAVESAKAFADDASAGVALPTKCGSSGDGIRPVEFGGRPNPQTIHRVGVSQNENPEVGPGEPGGGCPGPLLVSRTADRRGSGVHAGATSGPKSHGCGRCHGPRAGELGRLTFGGNIIETGTDCYRLATTRARAEQQNSG